MNLKFLYAIYNNVPGKLGGEFSGLSEVTWSFVPSTAIILLVLTSAVWASTVWVALEALVERVSQLWKNIYIYRKITKISPGAYIFQRPFSRGLFLEGLIFRGAYVRREICVSKLIGLALFLEGNLPFFPCIT